MATAKRKPPAFQFYAGDWLLSTLGMAWEHKGMYIDLLCWSWENGPLPDDPAWRQRVLGPAASRGWEALRRRWKKTNRGWVNRRLERQRHVQAAFRTRAAKGAATRWSQASIKHAPKHASSIDQASREHMLDGCSSSSSSSSSSKERKEQFAPRTVRDRSDESPAVLLKLAHTVLDDVDAQVLDPLSIPEEIKCRAAKAHLRYDGDRVRKALESAIVQRARATRRA